MTILKKKYSMMMSGHREVPSIANDLKTIIRTQGLNQEGEVFVWTHISLKRCIRNLRAEEITKIKYWMKPFWIRLRKKKTGTTR